MRRRHLSGDEEAEVAAAVNRRTARRRMVWDRQISRTLATTASSTETSFKWHKIWQLEIWALKNEEQRIAIIFLWQWWSARNKSNAGERVASTAEVCSSVQYHLQNFQKLQKDGKRDNAMGTKKWMAPPENMYKINVDGAFLADNRTGGWGFVIRDSAGQVLEGGAGKVQWAADALQMEAYAALKGLEKAAYWNMPHIILETDVANLGVADGLAGHGVSTLPAGEPMYWCEAPSFVVDLVSVDTRLKRWDEAIAELPSAGATPWILLVIDLTSSSMSPPAGINPSSAIFHESYSFLCILKPKGRQPHHLNEATKLQPTSPVQGHLHRYPTSTSSSLASERNVNKAR
ncbi:hypothetical protein PR202_gb24093 [Eleusine coracana subsp. coracana]|uniref:RNase H type-1 domain-containing protein n=1 Tax=Eleusine coracana subsp. coracana TaxID=191504 RepID=A0AAV5FK10_ELECO|nr:hypothetical protein PR202_gb24093 [Eleusine coracana subsp. coracana]